MSSVIEETLKALTEFESELDRAKADASEAKRQMIRKATELAETAKQKTVAEAKRIASDEVSRAQKEAEAQAARIRKKGEASLKAFEASLSKNQRQAAELVERILLGEAS